MFELFANAVNELAMVAGYTVIIASIVFSSLALVRAYFNRNKPTL